VTTFARYLLFQVPGWVLVTALLAWLGPELGWPASFTVTASALWALKDLLLYPFVASAYERHTATGAQRLCGETAIVCETLAPYGQVRLRGELWRACAEDGARIATGARVRVVRGEGLTLHVREEPGETARTTAAR